MNCRRSAYPILLAVLPLVVSGCKGSPPPRIAAYVSSPAHLERIHRVAFVELHDQAGCPEVAGDMTEALFRALQERQLFRVEIVRPSDPSFGSIPQNSGGAYSLKELADMRASLRCDAILLGTVTTFQPYPRMEMGLYLRLLDLRQGRLVWSLDHVWDTRDKAVERRVRDYFASQMREGYEPVQWHYITMSPSAFGKFIAHEVSRTLPSPRDSRPQARWPA